ncbi:MAG: large-conductance mechanosensitive channel [Clostridium sp. SCN 57-10]|nr:MAG: large-conductance mechanosensitive channel [Clostridium sp. SCN 57-10]
MEKAKGFLAEFKKFISRGNVMDMAVGIIIGGAFTAIVSSMVNDMLMPVIGKIIGGVNFTELKFVLTPAAGDVPEVALRYGNFLQKSIDFLLIAFVVFLLIRTLNRLQRKKEEAPAPAPDPQLVLLAEIRDLLKDEKEAK